MVIAIDGPAGAGKSTVARALASELGFAYLDSGAMYRCIGLLWSASPGQAPDELARGVQIELGRPSDPRSTTEPGAGAVMLDGRDVSAAIRAPEISLATSQVAANPGVREAMVARQRELIASGDWVVEGRDIGTVVAPHADLKIFLTADPQERARRRAIELGAEPQSVLAELQVRDQQDSARRHSPLLAADDAVLLDSTDLDLEGVVDRIAALTGRPRRSY